MQTALFLIALIGLLVLGVAALAFFYWSGGKPAGGVSKLSIRAVGIVFVVVAAASLALVYESAVVAAVGLLGAVAGYLFGASSSSGGSKSTATAGDISGDNARIAGRDMIEKQMVDKLESLNTTVQQLAGGVASDSAPHGYHVHEERVSRSGEWAYSTAEPSSIAQAHARALRNFPSPDYSLKSVSWNAVSDFAHVFFVFEARHYPADRVRLTMNAE